MPEPRLLEVRLPAGDVAGFDVMSTWNNGANRTKYTLDGHDGIRFIGRGRNVTHIRPRVGDATSSHATIVVGELAMHVEIEGATVWCVPNAQGVKGKGIHVGAAYGEPVTLRLRDVRVASEHPTTWGAFTYATFEDYEGVSFDLANSYEHADYAHGFAPPGRLWVDVDVRAGAECSKGVCRPGEARWYPNLWLDYKRCRFTGWFEEQSWRGGCGLGAIQGPGANVRVEECEFRAPKSGHAKAPVHQRSRCLMLSDTGPTQYSSITGEPAEHPGLGWIIIRRNLFEAGPGSENFSVMLRVGSENEYRDDPVVARGISIEENGIFGERMLAQFGRTKGPTVVRGNNTAAIKKLAAERGFDVRHECQYSLGNGGLRPFSVDGRLP